MARVICDCYVKGEKHIWSNPDHNPDTEAFNRKIVAVNDMYGWLYAQGVLEKVSFVFKDYLNDCYFAFDAKDLESYREDMEQSGVPEAALAVEHIFDALYQPCRYSGAIDLSWTMMSYRDFDGTVSRSWECDLAKHLNSHAVLDVQDMKDNAGVREAVKLMFELSGFYPSDIPKVQADGMVISDQELVDALVENYKERWTPDTADSVTEEVLGVYGPEIARFVTEALEEEYKSWFEAADTVDALIENAEAEADAFYPELDDQCEKETDDKEDEFVPY